MLKVLSLCTKKSSCGQMAEGWARHLQGHVIEAYSAGVEVSDMNPYAVAVMADTGVDITSQRSKHVDELAEAVFYYVVTVCDNANESYPTFRGTAKLVHKPFDDPQRMAREAASEEQAKTLYRRVRDEIRDDVATLPEALNGVDHGE